MVTRLPAPVCQHYLQNLSGMLIPQNVIQEPYDLAPYLDDPDVRRFITSFNQLKDQDILPATASTKSKYYTLDLYHTISSSGILYFLSPVEWKQSEIKSSFPVLRQDPEGYHVRIWLQQLVRWA